jgi:hypothetical protein
VIRGVLIFGAGLSIGYYKALSEVPEFKDLVSGVKIAWADAVENKNEVKNAIKGLDLDPEGVEHLLKHLESVLPAFDKIANNTLLISDESGVSAVTMGDLRAPFNIFTNNTQGETPR